MGVLPDDAEIHAVAERLGLLVDGQVPRESRSKIAQVALTVRERIAEAEDTPVVPSTAQALAQFRDDLAAHGFLPGAQVADLLIAVAPALVRRDGLNLTQPTTTEGNRT